MGNFQENWLPHLVDAIPLEARKNRTSMYTIALEGWRRGLKLKFYNLNENNKLQIRYSLSYQGKERYFDGSSGDMVSEKAFAICEEKGLANMHLSKAGVPIPKGREFDSAITEGEIIKYSRTISYPLVLKPTNGSGGKGVVANIKNELQLSEALHFVREELAFKEVIVEQFVVGDEVRVYVLGDKVLGAAHRRPANIVGNGINSIRQLIAIRNQERKKVPHLYYRPIKIDKEVKGLIKLAGYTLDSVPENGTRIFLRNISNVSAGGEPIDVTSELTTEHINIAYNAAKSIPGLEHCGVDMIINKESNSAVVLELNTRPGIGSHLFPVEGKAKDIPKEIIDYYFPETKGINTRTSNVYFDFKNILDSLSSRSTHEIEVSPSIPHNLYVKKYIITGELELVDYYHWLQRRVFKSNLNGFIKRIDNKKFEVVLAGVNKIEVDKFKSILKGKRKSDVLTVTEEHCSLPIKLGFEMIDGLNTMSLRELEDQIKQTKQAIKLIEKEQGRLKHRINLTRQSRTWKFTSPIRFLVNKASLVFNSRDSYKKIKA